MLPGLLGLEVGPDAGVIVGEVHGEVAEVSKCVSFIVVLGPEPQSLVVLERSRNIAHPEDRIVPDDPNRTT